MSDPEQWRPSALLTTVRETPRFHWLGLAAACLVGLVASSFHWSGIVLGGALVGALSDTVKRAVLAGVGFGLLTILVWASLLSFSGNLGKVTAMNEIALLPVGITLGLSVLGSLFRGTLS
jgi:DNA-binding transcriptional LysR family regulator